MDAIRKAGNRILFTVERKGMKLVHPKVYTLPISREDDGKENVSRGSTSKKMESVDGPADTEGRGQTPSPSPNLIFPCPKPYKGVSEFDDMIPSESKGTSAVVTVTVKHPDVVSKPVPELFPPSPTDLGTVTEVITKSTLTETVFTRVTHNEPVMVPLQAEVRKSNF